MRIISGTARRLQIKVPKSELRPTMDKVRGAVYSSLTLGFQMELKGARVLDLFAGSGAYGIEALSRGAGHADFVEREREGQQCIEHNLKATKLEKRGHIFPQDVFVWLNQFSRKGAAKTGGIYDLVIADPPYDRPPYRRDEEGEDSSEPPMDQTARLLVETPWSQLLNKYGIFVLEQSIERPVDLAPGLDMLRYRRYGKTLVVYYALPGSYEVKDNREEATEAPADRE